MNNQCTKTVYMYKGAMHHRCSRKALRNGLCWQHLPSCFKSKETAEETTRKTPNIENLLLSMVSACLDGKIPEDLKVTSNSPPTITSKSEATSWSFIAFKIGK